MTALNLTRRCLILACVLVSACGGGGGDNASTSTTKQSYGDGGNGQGTSCDLSSTSGIEGTGRQKGIEGTGRQKLTGRITGITVSGANTTVAVGPTCSFTADAASVFQGTAPASLSDLRVDQIITAEGDFTDTQTASANSIFILQNGANGQLPFVQLGTFWAPFADGTWALLDGPEHFSVLPQAKVLIDGEPVNAMGLTIDWGEIVLLGGQISFPESYNPGGLLASSAVTITHMVDGPVDAIDIPHNRITVLGQTVLFLPGFEIPPGAVNVGDRVSISGHPTAAGPIGATRIALSTDTGDFLVSGIVRASNPAQHVLTLNGVEIDYGAAQMSGVPASGPTNGERILVRAVRSANGTVLTATSISDDSKILGAGTGTVIAMHGIVTQVYSSSLMSVDGYPIKISDTALQTCGSTPPANSDVTLQGTVEADGTILADIYCFTGNASAAATVPTGPGIVQGPIQAIDPNYGAISILGFSAQPALTTRVMDSNGSMLSLGDLKVGDTIAVDGGYGAVPGLINAYAIRRIHGAAQSLVTAGAEQIAFADPIFYVNGNRIATDSSTKYSGYELSNDFPFAFTRAEFFAGKTSWPHWHRLCPTWVTVALRINLDGSLTALSVQEEYDPGGC